MSGAIPIRLLSAVMTGYIVNSTLTLRFNIYCKTSANLHIDVLMDMMPLGILTGTSLTPCNAGKGNTAVNEYY